MKTVLRVPKAAISMEEGTLTEWYAEDGAIVAEGDMLYAIEAEKSIVEVDAPASGRLRRIGVAGTVYKVGDEIAEIDAGSES